MPTHNNLIQNKIPQITKTNGKTSTTRILAEHEGTTLEEINNIRKKKAEERGGFSDRVFLIKVTDN
ncbi:MULTISPECIES: hypothetical protein [Bacillus cereus group]|uniref:hypothetical protein n=1 Tax=Bacillus cereus group TaxID=86661 RepID=UPI000BEBF741|nr:MULTISPECIES: hypothetical protein [Bacillus cereus group]MDF9483736.1 hypothetical protein [Bacillus cereus]PDY15106.1 hypothetical protein COM76_30690 [Bacillus cereus]PET61340.1 hypothetical protein CN522_21415 [Bacillus cereus]PEU52965.1 hypothetical protein CN414_21220 [Bacillus cereus]PEX74361.1 hypothetical protein CN457_26730 [Bacillus cereus]